MKQIQSGGERTPEMMFKIKGNDVCKKNDVVTEWSGSGLVM